MSWDYIIVGAGSAGCALASELVRAGQSVLVLEAGGSDWSPYIKVPAGQLVASARHDWGYQCEPDPSRNDIRECWPRGKVLGGSSSVNGMLWIAGAAEEFDRWSEHFRGAGAWSAKEIMPIFRELENSDHVNSPRGRHGPVYVSTVSHPHPITQAFVSACGDVGHPFRQDYNSTTRGEGVSYMQRSLRRGLRWSAADAFIKPLLRNKNLKVVLNAFVEKIEFSNGRAVGVSFACGRKLRRESASNIVLCAGVINTPKLLMLSGIGDREELGRHRISVVRELPGVGRNLGDHPLVRLVYQSNIPTFNLTEGLLQKFRIAAEFVSYREGPISNAYEALAFLRTTPSESAPDLMAYFAPVGYVSEGPGLDELAMARYPSIMICVAKIHPVSSGRIRLTSQNPKDPPLIEARLLADPADLETLVRGIKAVREIVRAPSLAGLIKQEIAPGPNVQSDALLATYVRNNTGGSQQPCGTCRMGIDADAVVDPNMRVRGVENLWIADASILPDQISANLNSVCMMIGKKLGSQLLGICKS